MGCRARPGGRTAFAFANLDEDAKAHTCPPETAPDWMRPVCNHILREEVGRMRIEQDTKHATVTVHNNAGARITMKQSEFDAKVGSMVGWYTKKKHEEHHYDKYHGDSKTMYDPTSPYPKQFTVRVAERGRGTNSKNGPVIKRGMPELDAMIARYEL